jgi:peptidoglycan/LPS O-acetylase OafA/YrhL
VQDAQTKQDRYQVAYSETAFIVIIINTVYYLLFVLVAHNKTQWLRVRFFVTLGAITHPLFLLHQNLGYMAFTYIHINKYVLLVLLLVV